MYSTKNQKGYIRVLADKQGIHTASRGGDGAVDLYKQIMGNAPENSFDLTFAEASELIEHSKDNLGWHKSKRPKALANYK